MSPLFGRDLISPCFANVDAARQSYGNYSEEERKSIYFEESGKAYDLRDLSVFDRVFHWIMDWMYPDEKIRKICMVFQRCKHEYLEIFHGLTISKPANQKQTLVENLKVRQCHLAFLEFIIAANWNQYHLYNITHPEVSIDHNYYKWFIKDQDLASLVVEPQDQVAASGDEIMLKSYAKKFQDAFETFLQAVYIFVMTTDKKVKSEEAKTLGTLQPILLELFNSIVRYKTSPLFKDYLNQNPTLFQNLKFYKKYLTSFKFQVLNAICINKSEKLETKQNMLTLKAAYLDLSKKHQSVLAEQSSLAQAPSSLAKVVQSVSTQTEEISIVRSPKLPVTLAVLYKRREQLEDLLDQVKDKIAELKGSQKKESTVSKKTYDGLVDRLVQLQEELGRLKMKFTKLESGYSGLLLENQNRQVRISSQNHELVRLRSELEQRNQEIRDLYSTLAKLQTTLETLLVAAVKEGTLLEIIAGSQGNSTQEIA